MLSCNEVYRELGGNYFDERRRQFTVERPSPGGLRTWGIMCISTGGSARGMRNFQGNHILWNY